MCHNLIFHLLHVTEYMLLPTKEFHMQGHQNFALSSKFEEHLLACLVLSLLLLWLGVNVSL